MSEEREKYQAGTPQAAATGDGPGASLVAELQSEVAKWLKKSAPDNPDRVWLRAIELAAPYDAEITRLRACAKSNSFVDGERSISQMLVAELAEARQGLARLRDGLSALASAYTGAGLHRGVAYVPDAERRCYKEFADSLTALLAATTPTATVEGDTEDLRHQIKALADRLDTIAESYDDYPLQREAYRRAAGMVAELTKRMEAEKVMS